MSVTQIAAKKLVQLFIALICVATSLARIVFELFRCFVSVVAMVRRRSGKRSRRAAESPGLEVVECAKRPALHEQPFACPAKVQLWMKADIYLGDGVGGVRNLYRHLSVWGALVEFQRRSGFAVKRRAKRVSWRDEEPGGKIAGNEGGTGVADPAVLAMGPVSAAACNVTLRYDLQRLVNMRYLPLSKRRPDCLDNYDYIVNKRSDAPTDEDRGGRGDMPGEVHNKRRSADPRERVRKESSPGPGGASGGSGGAGAAGVVLSPQRRSFTSGCYIPAGSAPVINATVIAQKTDAGGFTIGREQRRIGSGRILQRDITTVPWERGASVNNSNNTSSNDEMSNEYSHQYRPPNSIMRDRNNDERYERRSFGRDSYSVENKRDKDRDLDRFMDRRDRDNYRDDNRRNSRYNDRRRYDKDDEPEWFSGGPTSQMDTIELRGFDEPTAVPSSVRSNKFVNGKDSARDKSSTSISTSDSSSVMKSLDVSTVSGSNSNSGVIIGSGSSPEPAPPPARSTPTPRSSKEEITANNASVPMNTNQERNGLSDQRLSDNGLSSDNPSSDFNLDDFLKYDNIPGILSNGSIDNMSHGSSRFSQWFRQESPTPNSQQNQQQRYHDNVHERVINSFMDEIDQAISIPSSEEQHLFAPISPAASSSGTSAGPMSNNNIQPPTSAAAVSQNQHSQSGALFDMLQRNQQPPNKTADAPAKMHNLEELEARMRGRAGSGRIPQSQLTGIPPQMQGTLPHLPNQQSQANMQQPQRDDDIVAFKRLLAQVSEGHAVPATNGPGNQHKHQPMSLLQMLNKSDQAMEQQRQQQQAHIPHDLLFKLFHLQQKQQQQDMSSKMMPGPPSRHFQPSPIPGDLQSAMNSVQPSRELLSRPEAQAIIRGLRHGEITIQNLVQQISNPGLQSRHRETLVTILKMYQNHPPSPPLSMRHGASVPPAAPQPASAQSAFPPSHQLMVAAHQQLRVSPLPPNAFPPRIPSPRELQVHTQSIMHNALIKRKLEEQEQNFRRKQEAAAAANSSSQGRLTPSATVSPNKQPPLAFTPTSVLRKMTAEKDGDLSSGMNKTNQAPWLQQQPPQQQQQPKMRQGRPIVKGNQGGLGGPSNVYQQSLNQDFPSQTYVNHHHQQQQQQQMQMAARNKMASGNPGSANMSSSGPQQAQFTAMMIHMQQQRQLSQGQVNNNRGGNSTGLHQLFQMHNHRSYNDVGGRGASMGRGNDANSSGALSPTSNQLARWFSPELLAQATAGKLPPVNMAANALSLEELERIQHNSAIVHN